MLTEEQWQCVEEQVISAGEIRDLGIGHHYPCYRHGDYAPWSATELILPRCTAPGCNATWRNRVATMFQTFDFDDGVNHKTHYIVCEDCPGGPGGLTAVHIFEQSDRAVGESVAAEAA